MNENQQRQARAQLESFKDRFLVWFKGLGVVKKTIMLAILYLLFQVSDFIPFAVDDVILTLGYIWYIISQVDKVETDS